MKNVELESIIQNLTQRMYQYAFCLVPDELQAEQIVIDATSVYLMKEKNFLNSFDQELATKKEKLLFKRNLHLNLMKEVWNLGRKRGLELNPHMKTPEKFTRFYELDLVQRSALFLKDSQEYKWEDISFIQDAKKYQLIEKIYQAREHLLERSEMENERVEDAR